MKVLPQLTEKRVLRKLLKKSFGQNNNYLSVSIKHFFENIKENWYIILIIIFLIIIFIHLYIYLSILHIRIVICGSRPYSVCILINAISLLYPDLIISVYLSKI